MYDNNLDYDPWICNQSLLIRHQSWDLAQSNGGIARSLQCTVLHLQVAHQDWKQNQDHESPPDLQQLCLQWANPRTANPLFYVRTTRASQYPKFYNTNYKQRETLKIKDHSRIERLCWWEGKSHHSKKRWDNAVKTCVIRSYQKCSKVGSKQHTHTHTSNKLSRATPTH